MIPAERIARAGRGGAPDGSNEISPAAFATFMASHAARQARRHGITRPAARAAAARLIGCMDRRDEAGAERIITRAGRDADAVLGQVWQLEAERAYSRSAARWRVHHAMSLAAQQADATAAIADVIRILAAAIARAEAWPSYLRPASRKYLPRLRLVTDTPEASRAA